MRVVPLSEEGVEILSQLMNEDVIHFSFHSSERCDTFPSRT